MKFRWFRFVQAVLMTTVMVFWMTLVLAVVNYGFNPGFFSQWGQTFVLAYVVALPLTYFASPLVRRLTSRLVDNEH